VILPLRVSVLVGFETGVLQREGTSSYLHGVVAYEQPRHIDSKCYFRRLYSSPVAFEPTSKPRTAFVDSDD
jgi:hypothetical protein